MKAVVRAAREGETPTLVSPDAVILCVARAATGCGKVVHLPVDPPVRLTPGRGYVTEAVHDGEQHA
jgi:hypothetical protein